MFLSWVEPGYEFVNEEPVEYAYEDQAFDNSENLADKMTITLDLTTIIAMLVVSMLSLCRACYHLFIKPPKLP